MKYLRYLALAIFTFVIGVGISPIRFYGESIACGPRNSSSAYRSSYFIQTSFSYVTYETEEEASEAFKEQLSEAINILDLSPKVNKEGVLIKQRAVIVTYHAGNDEHYAEIFWRDGRTLRMIHSTSYTHVKEFEKYNF